MPSTGHRLHRAAGLIRVSAEELERVQKELNDQKSDPLGSNPSALEWHLQQTARAELRTNRFALAFHLRELKKLKPEDDALAAKLRTAETELATESERERINRQ